MTDRKPLRAYGWAGVSTPEQARSEKESIPAQIRGNQEAAERLGVRLVDTLVVPGFSRDYIDFHEMKHDMLSDGIDAFVRLERLWQDRAIDLFLCRDADRFGRTLAVLAYIAAQLVHHDARIYLVAKNMFIDRKNYTAITAMSGLMAEDEITRLRARHEEGMTRRFRDGRDGSNPPFSHRRALVDSRHRLILDESKALFFQDLADLLLAGLPYTDIAAALESRGHRNPKTGLPYVPASLRRFLLSPFTWGHVAFRWDNKHGLWGFDETSPPPPGVQVLRDKNAPVYTGDQAERIQAELRRRHGVIKGRARPDGTHRFTGLLVCAECGYNLTFSWGRYCCATRWTRRKDVESCANTAYLPEAVALEQISAFLRRWIERPSTLLPTAVAQAESPLALLAALAREIEAVEARIRSLIRDQSSAPESVRPFYAEQISSSAQHLDALRQRHTFLLARVETPAARARRERTREEIAQLGVERFFLLSDTQVNQTLHRLMGAARFVVLNGAITRIVLPE